jgi:polysaccharide pyruvyl transferase WcaK-like protein
MSVTLEAIREAMLDMIRRQSEVEELLLVSSTHEEVIKLVQMQTKLLKSTYGLYNKIL